jgi:hypothetical protein
MNQCHTNRGHIINDPILRFLQSLRSLQKSGVIKSVDEAYDFAKREFGEINDLFKRQIEQVFKTGKPAPKPGEGGITSIKNAPNRKKKHRFRNQGSVQSCKD